MAYGARKAGMSGNNGRRVLFIPSTVRGNGTGHIVRSIRLAEDLLCMGFQAAVLVSGQNSEDSFSIDELRRIRPVPEGLRLLTDAAASDWDYCIFDMRKTPEHLFSRFASESLCIGIDEGGEPRSRFDYLLDFLPNLEAIAPNTGGTAFLQIPDAPAESPDPDARLRKLKGGSGRVLVSFGGEDRAGLSGSFAGRTVGEGLFEASAVTVIRGGAFTEQSFPAGINILEHQPNLADRLKDYELVVTSFGLTCFEALYSGVPVVLLNPSDYHRRLSVKAGIPEIGTLEPDIDKLSALIADGKQLAAAVQRYSGFKKRDAAALIAGLGMPERRCRGCGTIHAVVSFRTENHSFFKCTSCGLVNAMDFGDSASAVDYGPDYFFDDYKKQYGRTYLEDFDNIKVMGMKRCRRIKRYSLGKRLLDIGCGYGPFMAAANDSGFTPAGIDISENAALWVRENLGYKALASAVEDFFPAELDADGFDAVTMWFVIEHLKSIPAVLEKINSILMPGGVFAFSTPNYNGISRRRSTEGFLRTNPLDHYTVWSPDSARRLLRRYGFRIKAVRCPVIHPERFFKPGQYESLSAPVRGIVRAAVYIAGRIFRLGDTFEVYAVKIEDCGKQYEK